MEFRNPPPTFTDCTSAEFVSDGHPDKLCDQFGDAIASACLKEDTGAASWRGQGFRGRQGFK